MKAHFRWPSYLYSNLIKKTRGGGGSFSLVFLSSAYKMSTNFVFLAIGRIRNDQHVLYRHIFFHGPMGVTKMIDYAILELQILILIFFFSLSSSLSNIREILFLRGIQRVILIRGGCSEVVHTLWAERFLLESVWTIDRLKIL